MAATFALTTGVVYVRSWTGTISGVSANLTGSLSFSSDTFLTRDAADIIAQRNTTTAQAFRVYNTFTSLSSGEYAGIDWKTQANVAVVGARTFATGSARDLRLVAQGNNAATSYGVVNISRSAYPFVRLGHATVTLATDSTAQAGDVVAVDLGTNTVTSGQVNWLTVKPTYNQSSGTAANTDFLINRTQTAVGSGAQKFFEAQIGGAPRFALLSTGVISEYADTTTAGLGVPPIVGYGNTVAATNTGTASIAAFTVGAADGTFEVSANCLVTTSTTHSFSLDVTYTDEGNTARTLILPVTQLAGDFLTGGLITNVTGAGPYESTVMTIRAKAATAITVRTSAGGTYTTVVYNARGVIKQVA